MLDNIEYLLSDECKLRKDRPIIVGVSGGPDSLCLMGVLHRAGYPIIVAHFNHQLRAEAESDAEAVERTVAGLGLVSVIEGADVRAYAETEKLSVEAAARELRYGFLFRLAHTHGAQAVAVGHTADDQVETVLMHFLRGAGLAGLKGMSYRTLIETFDPEIPVVRPLLDVSRAETVAYCTANGFTPHYDSSNDSLEYQRNRIRHVLLPNLESYNPNLRAAILRMSKTLSSDQLLLQETLDGAWRETATGMSDQAVTFDGVIFARHSIGLQRNLIKRAMGSLAPGSDVNFAAIERACAFIADPSRPPRVDLSGGLRMFREGSQIVLCRLDAALPINMWPQLHESTLVPVRVPAQVDLAGGWKFSGEHGQLSDRVREQAVGAGDAFQVWLDADALPVALELRARLRGDQFAPLGMNGHTQKLSDFMVNEKIPQRAREHWPLLCSGRLVIWVPGYRPAHPFRLRRSTKNVLHFSVARPDGQTDV